MGAPSTALGATRSPGPRPRQEELPFLAYSGLRPNPVCCSLPTMPIEQRSAALVAVEQPMRQPIMPDGSSALRAALHQQAAWAPAVRTGGMDPAGRSTDRPEMAAQETLPHLTIEGVQRYQLAIRTAFERTEGAFTRPQLAQ